MKRELTFGHGHLWIFTSWRRARNPGKHYRRDGGVWWFKRSVVKKFKTSTFAGSATCSITTALGEYLFVGVSPPASLLDSSLCLDMLSLSDAYSWASIGPPGIGGPRRR